ncbi:MAG TPA: hypothetical protein VF928_11385 [Usitatibacteraceae bacterium]
MKSRRQAGFVLLLIVLVMVGIGGAVLLVTLAASGASTERAIAVQASNSDLLRMARESVLGYAIGRFGGASSRPGQLPVPDTLRNSNYDGNADTGSCLDSSKVNGGPPMLTSATGNLRCLGRLPWKTLGIEVAGADEFDILGRVPWYAVSENLADISNCMTYLNPGTAAGSTASFSTCNDAGPAWPWLKVCDDTGRLVSDRVAVVLIMPGSPLSTTGRTQTRTGSPHPQPGDYLDAIPTPAAWVALAPSVRCSAYDNAGLTGEFVSAPLSTSFNDQLIYITIDELMGAIESRVATQVRESFISYRTAHPPMAVVSYPWLAPISNLSSGTDATIAQPGTLSGLVSFHTPTATSGQKFKTELAWKITTTSGSDTITSGLLPTRFSCFGGTYQCRLRTAGYGSISSTVTTANFAPLKTSSVLTPSVSCARSTDSELNCDLYSYVVSPTTSVSYYVQRRLVGTTPWSDYGGPYVGTQTRTVTIATQTGFAAGGGGVTILNADATHTVRRGFTGAGGGISDFLEAVDTWVPAAVGTAPFDLWVGSVQAGKASTLGTNGTITVSNIRVYPDLPAWYFTEKWYEYLYAAISPDVAPPNLVPCAANCFTAGARGNIDIVVISSGNALASQTRYAGTPGVTDFLEAPNSTSATTKAFAAPNQTRTSSYADSVVTIPR